MPEVRSTIGLNDGMSPIMANIYKSMGQVIGQMEHMQQLMGNPAEPVMLDQFESGIDSLTGGLGDVMEAAEDASHAISQIEPPSGLEEGVRSTVREQERLTKEVGHTEKALGQMRSPMERFKDSIRQAKGYLAAMGVMAAGRAVGRFVSEGIATADAFNTVSSQINMMNDGLQETPELVDMIMGSAARTRQSFQETAEFIVKMNGAVGEMFNTNAGMIQFAETFQQATIASGASARGMEVAMSAMERAMANGVLRANDFDYLKQNSMRTIQAIADYMGVSVMETRRLATEGKITAEVLANSLLSSMDAINDEFNQMPDTWGDHMNAMSNAALRAFQPLIEMFSDLLQSDAWHTAMAAWATGIQIVAAAAIGLFQIFQWGFQGVMWVTDLFVENLDWVVIALLVLGGVLIWLTWKWILAGLAAEESAIKTMIAWAKALWPITLIILAIVAFIWIMDMLGITVADVLGFVGGLFGAMFAFIFNLIALFWNAIASVAEFLVNVFQDPTWTIQNLFFQMISGVLNKFRPFTTTIDAVANGLANAFVTAVNTAIGALNSLIGLMNKIPGVDIGTVGMVSASGGINSADAIDGALSALDPGDRPDNLWTAPRMEMKSIGDTAASWANATRNGVNNIGGMISGALDGLGIGSGMGDFGEEGVFGDLGLNQDFLDGLNGIEDGIGGLGNAMGPGLGKGGNLGDIGRIREDVSISDEDIKLMRDIAERNFVLNYQQLTPEINLTINNREGQDDKALAARILDQIEELLDEQSASNLSTAF